MSVIDTPSKKLKAFFVDNLIAIFIAYRLAIVILIYCVIAHRNCFYDVHVYVVGHVNSENESQASSAYTLRYDWFAFCLINIQLTIFEGLNRVIK